MCYGKNRPPSSKYSYRRADIQPKDFCGKNSPPKIRTSTVKSSLKITAARCLYFVIFYSVLFGFSLGYLNLFMHFQISRDYPKLTGRASSLGFNPGLSALPVLDIFTSLIGYVDRQPQSVNAVTSQLLAYLQFYQLSRMGDELNDCSNYSSDALDIRRPGFFNLDRVGPCNLLNDYGFEDNSPCILLKVNKIYGWVPDPVPFAHGVLVTCEGATVDDTQNLGEINYFDYDTYGSTHFEGDKAEGKRLNGTFPSTFFPYLNQPQYQQPLVFVMFRHMKPNTLVRVQCYLIAKNIRVDRARGEGSVKFEILSH
ncbi:unnamed protein product [Dibothriocephalus latus]|uniref:Sodium/potassium-transporting ATPase subunit beta n=1 Tax=Dibothriocephalus latus TaxID=60516 RepID=A0A3P6P1H7_DIBLA|nr:unnamed protein product [Dibothriocephalus latus]